MSAHPTHDELFAAAESRDAAPASVTEHLASCDACRVTFARLQGGAMLVREARRDDDVPEVRWDRIDDAIAREAERAAAEFRAQGGSNVRSIHTARRWASVGVALAAAAALAVYVRSKNPREDEYTAQRLNVVRTPPRRAPEVAPPARPAWEGSVLLAAGGATWHEAQGGSVRLSEASALREGGRIETTSAGRAVVTVQPGWKLDVRPDTTVAMRALRQGEATLALARGAVALRSDDDVQGAPAQVNVESGRWTVGVHGAVVARAEVHSVRVVVLSGRVDVGAAGAPRVEYSGPIELELPETGSDARVVSQTAEDAARIDMNILAAEGALAMLPPIDPTATLTVVGNGALPQGLEAARFSRPLTIRARTSHGVMVLEVGSGRVLQWAPLAPVVATTQPPVNRATTPPTNTLAPQPPEQGRDLTPAEHRAMSSRLASRFSPCVATCQEQNRCAETVTGNVDVDVEADGRVTIASVDPSAAGARQCLVNQAQFVRFPATGGAFQFQVPIGRR